MGEFGNESLSMDTGMDRIFDTEDMVPPVKWEDPDDEIVND
jgi:hypothetical protein